MSHRQQSSVYVEGSIVRVKLENFVTYDSVEFRPGPHLNVIIGPNGTGKSSIVCAICLGLAGKANMLGRATQATEFIKHGCTKASIELELYNADGDNWVIKREIIRHQKNPNVWSVNGRQAAQKLVEEKVARLNIQVGNLTQFLPQDKVADFARMSQQELLDNTEKAVGKPEMYENHCKLKNVRESERKMELSFKNLAERLDQEKQKNERLEVDVKNFEERRRHLEKVKVLQMKRPWVEYEEKRQQYTAEKEEKEVMMAQVKQLQAQNKPLTDALKQAKDRSAQVDKQMEQKNVQIRDKANLAAKRSREIEVQTDKRMEIQDELKGKKTDETSRRKKTADLKKVVDSLQAELGSLTQENDVQPQLEKCTQEITKTNRQMTSIQHQGQAIKDGVEAAKREVSALKTQLSRLQDVSNQRLEALRNKHRHTYQATLWLRENRHLFKKMVFEPMALLINMKDPKYAKFVETRISFGDMRMFLFEDADECNMFLKEVRGNQRLVVNAGKLADCPPEFMKRRIPLDHLKKYGFYGYLKDLFTCPDPVMAHLCRMNTVHALPVGTNETKKRVEQILKDVPTLREFYTENHSYTVKISKYSGVVSTSCSEIRKPELLKMSLDTQAEEEVKYQLQEKQEFLERENETYKKIQKQFNELEKKMNQLRDEKKQLQNQSNRKKSIQSQIGTKLQRIQQLERESIDIEAEEQKAKEKLDIVHTHKCKLLGMLKDLTKDCLNLSREKVTLSLRQAHAQRQKDVIEMELKEKRSDVQVLERQLEDRKDRLKVTKDEARRLLDVAKRATSTNQKEELSDELKEVFSSCPNTVEEIDHAIHDEQARADCTVNTDENVVREYEERKKDIYRLERDVTKQERDLKTHKEEIEKIKTEWLEPLQDLIKQISHNFRQFFRILKCAGEVDLSIPENPEDYEKYGIRIKVKYRDNEQLRELNPHHQSGGERSVATVCYMMALQELSKCPFRCVDEINQGMDPINERKIFELVVQTACKEGTSQYFLLTPKLLPDLDYSERMTVLCIFNGPHMLHHSDWNLKKFLHRLKRVKKRDNQQS